MSLQDIQTLVKTQIHGYVENILITGKGGIGKSYTIQNEYKKHLKPKEYTTITSYITPLQLYITLWENKNKKIILFDDCLGLMDNNQTISILRTATQKQHNKNKKIIQYHSTTKTLQNKKIPPQFEFKPKITIITNQTIKNQHSQALKDRFINYHYEPNIQETKQTITKLLHNEKLNEKTKQQLQQYLLEKTNYCNITLRDYNHAINLLKSINNFNKFTQLFNKILQPKENKTKKNIYELINKHANHKNALNEFTTTTGKKKTVFYKYLKQMQPL